MAADKAHTKYKKLKQSDRYSRKIHQVANATKVPSQKPTYSWLIVGAIAISVGYVHSLHVSSMFENHIFFSHLSNVERELSFRTEMGLYYSYYKNLVEADTWANGMTAMVRDRVTEFPEEINTLQRFNLYPEVIVGSAYRYLLSFGIFKRTCYQINRGSNLPPVQSCEGMGEPIYFYVSAIFFLSGVMMAAFFLLCYEVSGNILGGLVGVICYFYNHGECTRVQWTAPLRESFSYPFLIIQMLVITKTLRLRVISNSRPWAIAICTLMFMLPWQFAQFALLTQLLALSGLHILHFVTAEKLSCIVKGLLIALFANFILQFGNSMLLTSYYTSGLITVSLMLLISRIVSFTSSKVIIVVTKIVALLGGTIGIKFILNVILAVKDDEHIGNLLRSKFSDYKNFDTMLYTCAAEFDFMAMDIYIKLSKTLVLPLACLCVIIITFQVIIKLYYSVYKEKSKDSKQDSNETLESNFMESESHIVYHVVQAAAFCIMATLIMRLKLFFTPQLCLLTSLIASEKIGKVLKGYSRVSAVFVIIGLMSIQGYANLKEQINTNGEYSNVPMEELMEWIQSRTPRDAAFAGTMGTMATVKLCTGRPIVNHPHYEHEGLRNRTKLVYEIYSRKSPKVVYKTLKKLKINYVIMEPSQCQQRPKAGCSIPELYDLQDFQNRDKSSTCDQIIRNPKPFTLVFNNHGYYVYQL
ncbi:putative C-mannosyltransferase DPY19L1 [Trichoplax sp. H2]|nr:putative C-mannosyltransferase DPY19L1 [Trichoplax sp. H2]|eukprot:RDD40199.1 putative C-mannosyltransferase DPY19L1 [Trichoplax sp. H2]